MFAGLVDGGAPGNVGVRVSGAKLADPKVVAHIANLLGAPAPAQTTSVRVRGYPAQLGLAPDENAHLRRYAQEAFGPKVPIRVHRCTQLVQPRPPGLRPGAGGGACGLAGGAAGRARHPPPIPDLGADHPQFPSGTLPARMTCPQGPDAAQQHPADAQDAPDHTGDLAMANAEPAVVDVDEEDEDML